LQPIADAKILQWANEARRLKVPELREYIAPRREALLLALLRQARGQVLDDLTHRERGAVNDALLGHIAPLGWNHIGLTGVRQQKGSERRI
jgi:hypothetical protein